MKDSKTAGNNPPDNETANETPISRITALLDPSDLADLPTPGRSTPGKINKADLLELCSYRLPLNRIAKILNVSRQAVCLAVKRHFPDGYTPKCRREVIADIYTAKEVMALKSLTKAKLEKAPARDLAVIAGVMRDKADQCTGQAGGGTAGITVNINLDAYRDPAPLIIDVTGLEPVQDESKDE